MKKVSENVHEFHRERMRAKYIESHFKGFEDHEVIEFLLFYAVPRRDTNELAHRLINEYGSLINLFEADPVDVQKRCKVSEKTAIMVTMAPHIVRRYFQAQNCERDELNNSRLIGKYVISLLSARAYEAFYCVCLDTKRRVIGSALLSEGSKTQTEIYPRQVVECALKYRASGIVIAHNHPSTDLLPSSSDESCTQTIKRIVEAIDIDLIDHVIVGGNKYYSFAEHNKL